MLTISYSQTDAIVSYIIKEQHIRLWKNKITFNIWLVSHIIWQISYYNGTDQHFLKPNSVVMYSLKLYNYCCCCCCCHQILPMGTLNQERHRLYHWHTEMLCQMAWAVMIDVVIHPYTCTLSIAYDLPANYRHNMKLDISLWR